jgi:hypothetical protein
VFQSEEVARRDADAARGLPLRQTELLAAASQDPAEATRREVTWRGESPHESSLYRITFSIENNMKARAIGST